MPTSIQLYSTDATSSYEDIALQQIAFTTGETNEVAAKLHDKEIRALAREIAQQNLLAIRESLKGQNPIYQDAQTGLTCQLSDDQVKRLATEENVGQAGHLVIVNKNSEILQKLKTVDQSTNNLKTILAPEKAPETEQPSLKQILIHEESPQSTAQEEQHTKPPSTSPSATVKDQSTASEVSPVIVKTPASTSPPIQVGVKAGMTMGGVPGNPEESKSFKDKSGRINENVTGSVINGSINAKSAVKDWDFLPKKSWIRTFSEQYNTQITANASIKLVDKNAKTELNSNEMRSNTVTSSSVAVGLSVDKSLSDKTSAQAFIGLGAKRWNGNQYNQRNLVFISDAPDQNIKLGITHKINRDFQVSAEANITQRSMKCETVHPSTHAVSQVEYRDRLVQQYGFSIEWANCTAKAMYEYESNIRDFSTGSKQGLITREGFTTLDVDLSYKINKNLTVFGAYTYRTQDSQTSIKPGFDIKLKPTTSIVHDFDLSMLTFGAKWKLTKDVNASVGASIPKTNFDNAFANFNGVYPFIGVNITIPKLIRQ